MPALENVNDVPASLEVMTIWTSLQRAPTTPSYSNWLLILPVLFAANLIDTLVDSIAYAEATE
jgi:hypothetical protein